MRRDGSSFTWHQPRNNQTHHFGEYWKTCCIKLKATVTHSESHTQSQLEWSGSARRLRTVLYSCHCDTLKDEMMRRSTRVQIFDEALNTRSTIWWGAQHTFKYLKRRSTRVQISDEALNTRSTIWWGAQHAFKYLTNYFTTRWTIWTDAQHAFKYLKRRSTRVELFEEALNTRWTIWTDAQHAFKYLKRPSTRV